jgi:hypothetical protein
MIGVNNDDGQNGLVPQMSALKQRAVSLALVPLAQVGLLNEKVSTLLQEFRSDFKSNGYDPMEVEEGQQYQMVFNWLGRTGHLSYRGRPPIWTVKSVSADFLSLPHARLVNQEDPCDIRTISCHAIAESRFFKLVSGSEEQREPSVEAA